MTPSFLEALGIVLLGGALLQAGRGLGIAMWRQSRARHDRATALTSFRETADALLQAGKPPVIEEEPGWSGYRKFLIHRRVEEAKDVVSFYLRPYDGKAVPRFLPGQHLTFRIQLPGQSKSLVRSYALANAPIYANQYRIMVKRHRSPPEAKQLPPGQVSGYFHDTLDEGRIVDVRAPSGSLGFDPADRRPLVLIAGGIGLASLTSILHFCVAAGIKRQILLFYSVRNRAHHALYDELRQVVAANGQVRMVVCYTRPTKSCIKGRDYDYRGRISGRLLRTVLPSRNCSYFLCAPNAMQESLIADLQEWGVPARDIHFASYGPQRTPSGAAATAKAGGIEVVFARSRKTGHWSAGGPAILDLAEELGVVLESGCRAGQCGSCQTAIRAGDVTYLKQPAIAPAKGTCLTCIAVPKGKLVLDA